MGLGLPSVSRGSDCECFGFEPSVVPSTMCTGAVKITWVTRWPGPARSRQPTDTTTVQVTHRRSPAFPFITELGNDLRGKAG